MAKKLNYWPIKAGTVSISKERFYFQRKNNRQRRTEEFDGEPYDEVYKLLGTTWNIINLYGEFMDSFRV